MNGAHVHLLVNHVPIFGIAFGVVALIWAMVKNSSDMRWAAVFLFVISAAFSIAADKSGDAAEDLVKELPGVTKDLIHEHEEAADFAILASEIMAAGALILAFAISKKPKFVKPVQIALLILGVWASSVMARTAYLGGQIRHSEIRGETAPH